MEHQEHFGRKFYKDHSTGYWISTNEPKIRAHRWVWINLHGIIPKGYHIHHKNENKSDNSIENLELIEQSRHLRHHITEEKKEFSRKLMDKIRPMTKEWHASEEGKAWHRHHALKCKFGKGDPINYQCKQCAKEFESTKKNRVYFCSNNCKAQARRDSGIDNEDRNCLKCSKAFICNKYDRKKYCADC